MINETGVLSLILLSELPSAKKFKRWVTKEVLPSILKTGSYNALTLTQNEIILQIAQSNVELEKRVVAIEQKTEQDKQEIKQEIQDKLDNAIKVFASPSTDHWVNDMNAIINSIVETYKLSPVKLKGNLYNELEQNAGVSISSRQIRMRNRLKMQGVVYKERQAVTKLDVISKDKKLRAIFEGVVKKHQAIYKANIEQNNSAIPDPQTEGEAQ